MRCVRMREGPQQPAGDRWFSMVSAEPPAIMLAAVLEVKCS